MCGIVAVITSATNGFRDEERKAFVDMLFVDTLRGWDSTGVFSVDVDGDVSILKDAVDGPTFIQTTEFKNFNSDLFMNGVFAVGHNRAATRGSVIAENAHPFYVEDNIVLVQNGTWHGSHHHVKNTVVDTEVIAHLLHENEDIEKALQKVDAAFALIWYNVKEQTLYAINNGERPLCIAYLGNGTVLLASEISTLEFAIKRQGLKLTTKPYEIKEGVLCSWKSTKDKLIGETRDINCDYSGAKQYNYGEWGGVWDGVAYDRPQYPVVQLSLSEKENEVSTTITECISKGYFQDWELSLPTCIEITNKFHKQDFYNNEFVVEFIDSINTNYCANCKAWYIVGSILAPETNGKDVLIYSLIQGKTAKEISDMYLGKSFKIKPTSLRINKVFNVDKHVVSLMAPASLITPMEIQ